jgi:hypothetical protein
MGDLASSCFLRCPGFGEEVRSSTAFNATNANEKTGSPMQFKKESKMKGKRHLVRFIALLAIAFLTLSLAIGPVAGQEPGPNVPGQEHDVYVPLVQRAPNTLYGRVTDDGVAAPGVLLTLWFYNGSIWDDIDTTNTDSNGNYLFTGMPALLAGQKYVVEYLNETDPTRLWVWDTRELTSFSTGSVVNIGNFDLANVVFSSPAPGSEAVPPQSFQWSRRPTTPSDSYQFNLLDIYDNNPSFVGPPVGYASSYTLGSLPAGFQYCNPYFWGVKVNSPDGGWGMSYYVYLVTLHQTALSGIHGCVTEDGTPRSDVPVKLWRYNSPNNWSSWNATTNSSGYFQFTGKSGVSSPQFYLVEYYAASAGSRIGVYDTRTLTPYTGSSSAFIGDFDIDNILLSWPNSGANVNLPETFQWMRRWATPLDDYTFDLFDLQGDVPDFIADELGYVGNYDLTFLPGGYNYGELYGWGVLVDDVFGGWGASYYYNTVSFSSTALNPAHPEAPGELQLEPQQFEAMRLRHLGQSQAELDARWRQHPDYAGLRNLQVKP